MPTTRCWNPSPPPGYAPSRPIISAPLLQLTPAFGPNQPKQLLIAKGKRRYFCATTVVRDCCCVYYVLNKLPYTHEHTNESIAIMCSKQPISCFYRIMKPKGGEEGRARMGERLLLCKTIQRGK